MVPLSSLHSIAVDQPTTAPINALSAADLQQVRQERRRKNLGDGAEGHARGPRIQNDGRGVETHDGGARPERRRFHRPQGVRGFSLQGGAGKDDSKELRDAFDLYDVDKNGLISAKELHDVLRNLGEKCSLSDCRRMISNVDADGDGNVNFEEFKKMMTRS
ncbi:Putative calcium-binding protein CML27 [Glycine soja]|nr:Putative calcium-binding protein CML27 [Glycine soja]